MPRQDASGEVIFGSFFRYHGWLSPGVRLFRSISFPAKASWISLMFLVPLITTLWFIWSAANEQITATHSERDGITYVQPTLDLIKAAQGRRQAAMDNSADLASWQSQVAAAFDTLSATDKTLGTRLSTAEPFRALNTQHQKLLQAPLGKNADETFEEHNLLIQAALNLVHEVADSSQLTLDPAADTFFLMEFSVRLAPVQFENVAQLSALAQLVLKSGEMTPLRHDRMLVRFALLEFMEAQAESAYMKGIKNFAPQEQEFNMTGVDKAAVTFADTVKQLLESNRAQGDLASVKALGTAALDQQFKIDRQVLALLDNQLSARITELRQSFNFKLGLSLLFVFVAFYMMLAFYKVMMGGLREVSGHLRQITEGNLATTPRPWGSDEAAQLMITMGEMEQSLRTIVRSVLDSAANVNTASEEIASASNDLSRRTEANAASLEETASSMVRISETVLHTSETVTNTSNIVRANAVSAEHGGVVISQVVNTMGGIQASSNKIGEIISVIEGIAFQTNILALNAAVEAARAGEQGRGFAVVATEVRALASRSAAAAKEIKALINESIDQVEKGGQVVMEAGNTIREIVANAAKINTLISDIASDTREQSTGVAQVGDAVNQLDQSTQQNAALVEETAAAATALAEQARRLADEVNFFKLK